MLGPMPGLRLPTTDVRDSFLLGECAVCASEGLPTDWLTEAARDFAAFVGHRRRVRELWGVPTTELWFVDGADYLGSVMVRHRLTPTLLRNGGHVGYHIVPAARRRGHATAMLGEARGFCRRLGLTDVLVTCAPDNTGSRRVIEANGGVIEDVRDGECRYWLSVAG